MMTKAELRRQVRARYEGSAREEESRLLCAHILQSEVYREARTIAGYIPLRWEADVTPVMADALMTGKTLLLPRCGDAPEMTFRRVESLADLVPGRYGILEPAADAPIVPIKAVEMLLVPLEAIDKHGFRLGKGGGYYDRALAGGSGTSVGCALSWQMVDEVPREAWDIPLCACASRWGLRLFDIDEIHEKEVTFMQNKKHKQQVQKVTKPYMRGDIVDRTTLPGALKFFFATVALMVVFLIIGVMMNMDNRFLAIAINGAMVASAYLIFHQTGAAAGADAVNQGEIMLAREAKGRPVEVWERQQCYHPFKGLVRALIGSIPILVCSVILACIAQPQVSNLGTLPSWVGGIESRPEIGGALAYYHAEVPMSLESLMRLVVRMTTMPYVNMIGAESREGMLLLERVSPLLNLLPAAAYGIGYMMGVSIRTSVHTNIALGKKKTARKQKKERRARQQTRRGPEQLN